MTTCVVQVDELVQIGESLVVSATDIDKTGVRLLVRGRIVGGPSDGETVNTTYELGVGKSISISPSIAVALQEIDGLDAVLKVFAPPTLAVQRVSY